MRTKVTATVHSLIFVFLYGFLTAGNWAGHSMNTFPKVGDDWMIGVKHFNKDVNFY